MNSKQLRVLRLCLTLLGILQIHLLYCQTSAGAVAIGSGFSYTLSFQNRENYDFQYLIGRTIPIGVCSPAVSWRNFKKSTSWTISLPILVVNRTENWTISKLNDNSVNGKLNTRHQTGLLLSRSKPISRYSKKRLVSLVVGGGIHYSKFQFTSEIPAQLILSSRNWTAEGLWGGKVRLYDKRHLILDFQCALLGKISHSARKIQIEDAVVPDNPSSTILDVALLYGFQPQLFAAWQF